VVFAVLDGINVYKPGVARPGSTVPSDGAIAEGDAFTVQAVYAPPGGSVDSGSQSAVNSLPLVV